MKIGLACLTVVLGLIAAPLKADDAAATAPSPAGNPAKAQGAQDTIPTELPASVQTAETDKPWTLPQPGVLQDMGINVSGWLEAGLTLNSLSPSDRWNGPVATNDRSNEFEMNQLWMAFVKPVKTDGCGFDVGGRVDVVYGTDWRYGDSLGLESNIDSNNNLYGLVLPQFYLEVGYNDLTVKMGHYAACMGYEVVAAPGNFFYSHSYCLGYSEPILVTGLQADYKLTDNWSINGGFNRGFNMFDDDNDKLDFMGGAKWHNDSNKTSLSFEIDAGPQDPLGVENRYDYALVFKQQLSEKLLYVAQNNMGGEEGGDPYTGGYATWYGLAQYLIYTINPQWSAGTRIEWFRDQNGGAVAGIGNVNLGWDAAPGFQGTFTEWTTGLNWRPHPNLVIRPELRCDWYSGSTNMQGALPFGDGKRSEQVTLATDFILTF